MLTEEEEEVKSKGNICHITIVYNDTEAAESCVYVYLIGSGVYGCKSQIC